MVRGARAGFSFFPRKGLIWESVGYRLTLAIFFLFTLSLALPALRPAGKFLSKLRLLELRGISFFQSEKGEPSYPKSRLWTTNEWRERIDRGVEQAFASFVPACDTFSSLNEALSSLRSERIERIAMDNYESTSPLTAQKEGGTPMSLGSWARARLVRKRTQPSAFRAVQVASLGQTRAALGDSRSGFLVGFVSGVLGGHRFRQFVNSEARGSFFLFPNRPDQRPTGKVFLSLRG